MSVKMNKTIPQVKRELTEEERKEAAQRFISKRIEQVSEGAFYNLLHNPNINPDDTPVKAKELATRFVENLYGLDRD